MFKIMVLLCRMTKFATLNIDGERIANRRHSYHGYNLRISEREGGRDQAEVVRGGNTREGAKRWLPRRAMERRKLTWNAIVILSNIPHLSPCSFLSPTFLYTYL